MASSSLQYVKDWRALLGMLVDAAAGHLYVTRQPFVMRAPSYVVVQRADRHGYRTQYPGWVLNRDEFLREAERMGLRLLREFLIDERPRINLAPEQPEYRGFLFAPPSQGST